MKYLSHLFFLLPLFFFLPTQDIQAQNKARTKIMTDSIEVSGVCKMCKARIEEAAMYVRGVKMAEWSAQAQQLTVIYKTKKTSVEQICQAIAKVGHDSELVESTEEAYKELPGCCLYRDGVEVH